MCQYSAEQLAKLYKRWSSCIIVRSVLFNVIYNIKYNIKRLEAAVIWHTI